MLVLLGRLRGDGRGRHAGRCGAPVLGLLLLLLLLLLLPLV